MTRPMKIYLTATERVDTDRQIAQTTTIPLPDLFTLIDIVVYAIYETRVVERYFIRCIRSNGFLLKKGRKKGEKSKSICNFRVGREEAREMGRGINLSLPISRKRSS